MELMTPFSVTVDAEHGTIAEAAQVQYRRLSDMQGLYADSASEAAHLAENPLIYEVHLAYDMPPTEGQLAYSTTIIHPGQIGHEYFMTKGHYHAKGDRGELYYGLKGEGALLMQSKEGEVHLEPMKPGTGAYVPPYWGHRTINVGQEPFVFLAVYPADAGYDYQSIAEKGFAVLVTDHKGQVTQRKNPKWI